MSRENREVAEGGMHATDGGGVFVCVCVWGGGVGDWWRRHFGFILFT